MPLINPEEAIKNSFKILSRRRRSRRRRLPPPPPQPQPDEVSISVEPISSTAEPEPPPPPSLTPASPPSVGRQLEIILPSTKSVYSEQSDLRNTLSSRGSSSGISEYIYGEKSTAGSAVTDILAGSEEDDLTESIRLDVEGGRRRQLSTELKRDKKKKFPGDRRMHTWVPCTCPQYKVSHELAAKWDAQAIFFGKIMAVKVIQLLVINLVIFGSGYHRQTSLQFFRSSHDWAYLAFGLFLAYLLCIRVGMSYRARWPKVVTYILMCPMVAIIAFVGACITVIYNSVLIPLITCSCLLAFILLCFMPYLLRKSVMSRALNFAGCGLGLLASTVLLFLKEVEVKPLSYWDFGSHVWLPGLLITQVVIQVTIFEIQRVIFGLCFNVSTKRWHVAALYI